MSKEVIDKLDELGKVVHEYRDTNDKRLDAIEKDGSADPILSEKLEKMDKAIDTIEALNQTIDDLEKQINRAAPPSSDSGSSDEQKNTMNKYLRAYAKSSESDECLNALRTPECLNLLRTDSLPDGGAAVLPEMDKTIRELLTATVAMERLAQKQTVGAKIYDVLVDIGGETSGYTGETTTKTETETAKLEKLSFPTRNLFALPKTTQDMLDDSEIDVVGWINSFVGRNFAEKAGQSYITGNAEFRPRGILTYETVENSGYSGSGDFGSVGFTSSGAAELPTDDGVIDLVYGLPQGYRQNASFIMNNASQAKIRKLKDGNLNYIWQPGLQLGQPATLAGYPINEDDNMPDFAAGTFSIAFGDWRAGYLITERQGMSVLRDDITQKGFVLFYVTMRHGGGIQNFEAIKFMKTEE